jgi:hypothetical protein
VDQEKDSHGMESTRESGRVWRAQESQNEWSGKVTFDLNIRKEPAMKKSFVQRPWGANQ